MLMYVLLQDLKEQEVIQMEWVYRNKNSSDLGTQNLNATSPQKHNKTHCCNDNKF